MVSLHRQVSIMDAPRHPISRMTLDVHAPSITSDGGSTSYYELPADANELNDLNKIIFFADRLKGVEARQ